MKVRLLLRQSEKMIASMVTLRMTSRGSDRFSTTLCPASWENRIVVNGQLSPVRAPADTVGYFPLAGPDDGGGGGLDWC